MLFVETHIAGDTLDFTVEVPEYPNTDGWTLKYRLKPNLTSPVFSPVVITALNNADGSYQIQETPTNTATWPAGAYTWSRWVEKTGARQTLNEHEPLVIRPNPATSAQGLDTRTHNRKMLEQIEAALESRSLDQQREVLAYTIGSRSQTFDASDTRAALLELRSKYEWLVKNEDDRAKFAAAGINPRNVGIRFGRT